MSTNNKLNILFIKNEKSEIDTNTEVFTNLFETVEKVLGEQKALKLIYKNKYDVIIADITEDALDGITFMKQIKELKPMQNIVTLVSPKDEDKLGDLIEGQIHAFVLTPEQFEQALEAISLMKA